MRFPRLGRVASLGLLLVAASPAGAGEAAGPHAAREPIYAAALGYAAEQLAAGRVGHVCIGLDAAGGPQDPDPALLAAVRSAASSTTNAQSRVAPDGRSGGDGLGFVFRPASDCKVSSEGATLLDGRTPAVTLLARDLDRVSSTRVLVEVIYVFTWRQRGIRTYEVRRVDSPGQPPLWRAAGEVTKQAPV